MTTGGVGEGVKLLLAGQLIFMMDYLTKNIPPGRFNPLYKKHPRLRHREYLKKVATSIKIIIFIPRHLKVIIFIHT